MSIKLSYTSYGLSNKLEVEKLDRILAGISIRRSTLLDYVYPNNVKIASVHMKLAPFSDLRSFVAECSRLVDCAVRGGAHVVLFPHLCGLLPLTVHRGALSMVRQHAEEMHSGKVSAQAARTQFTSMMEQLSDFAFDCYYTLFLHLAQRYNVYIAAGSTYVLTSQGTFCRSYLFSPDHDEAFFQDKIHLNEFERLAGVQAGTELQILNLKIGRVALLAELDSATDECYKVAQRMGAQIVLSPALLGETAAYTTQHNASLMAAQHYNLFTARSSFFSPGGNIPAFDGASGVYAPQVLTKNLDGVVAHLSESGAENQVLCARIDPPKLADNTDVYSYSSNADFSQGLIQEIYPAFFKSSEEKKSPEEEKPTKEEKTAAEEKPAE